MDYEKIECKFYEVHSNIRGNLYTCEAIAEESDYFPTINPNIVELKFTGKHQLGKSYEDVQELIMTKHLFSVVPQRLTICFPNLRHLELRVHSFNREDLKEYTKLVSLRTHNLRSEFLPGDLFVDLKQLQGIYLGQFCVDIIEPNLLDGLKNLKYVNIKCIDSVYDSILTSGNATLDEIKEKINEKFSNMDAKVKKEYQKILAERKVKRKQEL